MDIMADLALWPLIKPYTFYVNNSNELDFSVAPANWSE